MIVGMSRTGTKTYYFASIDNDFEAADKEAHDFKATRFVYCHNDHPDFHKVIITVTEQDGSMINLAFIQYYFDNGEHDIDFEGSNSNNSRTLFSTRKTILSLKDQKRKGKKTFDSVTNSVGGFELARTLAELPNSYKHIYDVIRKNDIGKETDELIELLDLCKGQIGTSSAFIRDVRTAPEKSVFESSDNQLHDIERFCAGNYCWSILGVDPTFNICDYYVTVSTYKHSLLVKNGTNEHPVMVMQPKENASIYCII